MKTTLTLLPLAMAMLLGSAFPARAGLILQPLSVSTNMGTFAGNPDRTRDQSGLSTGYNSLVDDFGTYLAGSPAHDSQSGSTIWQSAFNTTTGNFDFALGGTFTIQSFALWNQGSSFSPNLRGFELLASADSTFSSSTSLGTFDANPNTGPHTAVLPQVFTFAPTSAAFVRMVITSNNGNGFVTSLGEAAFEVQHVPEPASLTAWFGLALVGAAATRVRQRRSGNDR